MMPEAKADRRERLSTPEPAYLLEMLRIVEAATNHDAEKLSIFVGLLVKKLQDNNFAHAAKLIEKAFNRSRERQLFPQSLSQVVQSALRIPVDPEGHVPLADLEILSRTDVDYEPDPAVSPAISSFLSTTINRGKLLANGITVPTNLLLYGPPGCGKTVTARHVAAALGLPLLTARMDAVVSSYLGNTAKNIRSLFNAAASQNAVLFLDELDALGKARDDQYELGELKRVVIALLQNIDATSGKITLLAATNHGQLLDPAIWRRFPHRVNFGLPAVQFRRSLFVRFASALSEPWLDALAHASRGLSAGDIQEVIQRERIDSAIEDREVQPMRLLRRTLGIDVGRPEEIDRNLGLVARKASTRDRKYFTTIRLADLLGMSRSKLAASLRRRGDA